MKVTKMLDAYFEAIHFTEEEDQNLDKCFCWRSRSDVYRFAGALVALKVPVEGLEAQIGHDLWLTRNRHGSGFWDRPEIYGEMTQLLTTLAHLMGEVEPEFEEE